jgi:hypothetical protein
MIDWELMQQTDAALYQELKPYISNDGALKWLRYALIPRVQEWVKQHDLATKAEGQYQCDMNAEQGRKDAQRKSDEAAGLARLLEWAEKGLLEDTKANSEHIRDWLETNVQGYISVANIDAAISILGPKGKSVLTSHKPKSTPPPPKTEPAELLGNGEVRLPLGTTPSSRHSVTQLRDLDARERAAKGRGGWHGAKF